jgi:hypothetical protein
VITDSGWQLLDFASQMRTLTGKNLTFRTLPVVTTAGRIDGQDVNIIDPTAIKQVVQEAFYPSGGSSATASPSASPSPSASASASGSSPSSSSSGSGDSGGVVTVPGDAPYGIPCVY